ncbi:MAG: phosphatase PAP2 family protein [Candidatus Aenigmarchaeota archaeon]|nr:phosphatase PAP2 family protein [Candidatus Aenigmarchaeota archaeon]
MAFGLGWIDKAVGWDRTLLQSINNLSGNPLLDLLFIFITNVGFYAVWALLAAILLWKREKKAGLTLLFGLAVDIVTIVVLKTAFHRPRPFEVFELRLPAGGEIGSSFPSGHTQTAFMAATILGSFYRKARWPLFALSILIGFSRLYLGVHYPLDVLAGALTGASIGLFMLNIFPIQKLQDKLQGFWNRMKGDK